MKCRLNFREFYNEEDSHQLEGKIKMLVYGQNFIFFFVFNDQVYGGGEEARLSYATMKEDEEGVDEMVFSARNLSLELYGKPQDVYFTIRDINNIDIINNREAEQLLGGS